MASYPPAGSRFLAGLLTGSAFGMIAVWWFGRRRRRLRQVAS
ncbi:hypothetical protein ACGFNP_21390 [Nonomuraea sp. NPDC049269]